MGARDMTCGSNRAACGRDRDRLLRKQRQHRPSPVVVLTYSGPEGHHAEPVMQYPVFFRLKPQVILPDLPDDARQVNVAQEVANGRQTAGSPPVLAFSREALFPAVLHRHNGGQAASVVPRVRYRSRST